MTILEKAQVKISQWITTQMEQPTRAKSQGKSESLATNQWTKKDPQTDDRSNSTEQPKWRRAKPSKEGQQKSLEWGRSRERKRRHSHINVTLVCLVETTHHQGDINVKLHYKTKKSLKLQKYDMMTLYQNIKTSVMWKLFPSPWRKLHNNGFYGWNRNQLVHGHN